MTTRPREVTTAAVADRIADAGHEILDVRPIAAYNGWRLRGEQRGGHVSTARSVPARWTRRDDWRETLADKDITAETPVTLYGYDAEVVRDVAETLTDILRNDGLSVHTNTEVRSVQRSNGSLQIQVDGGGDGAPRTITGSHLLVATGLRGNTGELGLSALGIETQGRGFLSVGDTLRTDVPTVYGAGDVIGSPAFVYTAAREGELAAENALEETAHDRHAAPLPWVIFTDPQVAGVGLGERQAADQEVDVDVATLPLDQVPRSIAARDTRGFIKLLRERDTDRLVGARILAPEGSELLMELSLAIQQHLTVEELTDLLHPYLTLSEGVKLAALTFDREVETLSCCAT